MNYKGDPIRIALFCYLKTNLSYEKYQKNYFLLNRSVGQSPYIIERKILTFSVWPSIIPLTCKAG